MGGPATAHASAATAGGGALIAPARSSTGPPPVPPPLPRPPYDVIRIEVRHGETGMVGNDLDLVAHGEATIEASRSGDPDHAVLLRQRGHGQVRLGFHRAHGLRPHVRGPRALPEPQRPRIPDAR